MKHNTRAYGPSFNCSKFEHEIINRIANRAVAMAADAGAQYDKLSATMDITACHCNGCELDLAKLEAAPDSDFGHDVFGIRRHINRRTGKLGDCFLPRCAMPANTSASFCYGGES